MPKPLSTASTTAPVATAVRKTLSMMKLRSCICPTMMPGSNTRDFSSAKPNTMPMAMPTMMARVTDMPVLLSDAAQQQHCGRNAAGKHRGDRDGRADRQLRHAGETVTTGAAVGDARAEQQYEATDERHGVTLG